MTAEGPSESAPLLFVALPVAVASKNDDDFGTSTKHGPRCG
jgi:hypothetical protein